MQRILYLFLLRSAGSGDFKDGFTNIVYRGKVRCLITSRLSSVGHPKIFGDNSTYQN